jgi:hypothetical protein
MEKVNLDILRPWIVQKVFETLGVEDEVIPEYVFSMLEDQVRCHVQIAISFNSIIKKKLF